MPIKTLDDWIKENPPDPNKKFAPSVYLNRHGNMLVLFWDEEESYADEIQDALGKNIGKRMVGLKSGRVTGVKIYLEAAGLKCEPPIDDEVLILITDKGQLP